MITVRTCPKCGGRAEVHMENFGMATRQCGPARCTDCSWVEGQPEELRESDLKKHEKRYIRFKR